MSETDLAALLRGILVNPADDAPRLIYTDALDEAGLGWRAEFIRVQIDVFRFDHTLQRYALDWKDAEKYTWLCQRQLEIYNERKTDLILDSERNEFPFCRFTRGFAEQIILPSTTFFQRPRRFDLKKVFAAHPITSVTLRDKVPAMMLPAYLRDHTPDVRCMWVMPATGRRNGHPEVLPEVANTVLNRCPVPYPGLTAAGLRDDRRPGRPELGVRELG